MKAYKYFGSDSLVVGLAVPLNACCFHSVCSINHEESKYVSAWLHLTEIEV